MNEKAEYARVYLLEMAAKVVNGCKRQLVLHVIGELLMMVHELVFVSLYQ